MRKPRKALLESLLFAAAEGFHERARLFELRLPNPCS